MSASAALIAIIDDDWPVLKALDRQLRKRSFKTATFRSATEFLAKLPQERPDCLILDLQMPVMNGLELLLHLKRLGVSIPTIVITASGGDDVVERCMAAGAVACLLKPLQRETLLAAIDEATALRTRSF